MPGPCPAVCQRQPESLRSTPLGLILKFSSFQGAPLPTLKFDIQHTSGSELSSRMTRRRRLRHHTWGLCDKSRVAFLSRVSALSANAAS